MLAAPGSLMPTTSECSIHPAAVLIDIDPALGEFLSSLHTSRDIYELSSDLRPVQVENVEEMPHWFRSVSEIGSRMDSAQLAYLM